MVRKLLAIAVVASVHAALSLGAFLIGFGHTMARFETGAPPTLSERVIDAAILILFFPVVHLARQAPHGWFSGLWGYVPFLLNSAVWAVLVVYAWQAFRDREACPPARGSSTPLSK